MSLAKNILVATDFSDSSASGLEMAADMARLTGAKVIVCHVLDPSPLAPYAARGAAGKQLEVEHEVESAIHDSLAELVRKHFQGVAHAKTALIISANAADGICHYAGKHDVDLIVLSTHGRTGIAHLLIGSVAEKVVRHAPCPVLTVRTNKPVVPSGSRPDE
jgi:universal stress protein A